MLFNLITEVFFSPFVILVIFFLVLAFLFQELNFRKKKSLCSHILKRASSKNVITDQKSIDQFMLSHKRSRTILFLLSILLVLSAAYLESENKESLSSIAFVFYDKNEVSQEIEPQIIRLKARENIVRDLSQQLLPIPISLWTINLSDEEKKYSLLVPPTIDSFFLSLIAGERTAGVATGTRKSVWDARTIFTPQISSSPFSDALHIIISQYENIPTEDDHTLFPGTFICCYLPIELPATAENVRITHSTYSFLKGSSLKDALPSLRLLLQNNDTIRSLETSENSKLCISLFGAGVLFLAIIWCVLQGMNSSLNMLFAFTVCICFHPGITLGSEFQREANQLVSDAELLLQEGLVEDGVQKLQQALQITTSEEARQRIYLSLSKAFIVDPKTSDQSIIYMKEALQYFGMPSTETMQFLIMQLKDLFFSFYLSIDDRKGLVELTEQYSTRLSQSFKKESSVYALEKLVQEQKKLLRWIFDCEWPYLQQYQAFFLAEELGTDVSAYHSFPESNFFAEEWSMKIPLFISEFRNKGLYELVDFIMQYSSLFSHKSILSAKEECYTAYILAKIFSRIVSVQQSSQENLLASYRGTIKYRSQVMEMLLHESFSICLMAELRYNIFSKKRDDIAQELKILRQIFEKISMNFYSQLLHEKDKIFYQSLFQESFLSSDPSIYSSLLFAWQFFSLAIDVPKYSESVLPEGQFSRYEDLLELCLGLFQSEISPPVQSQSFSQAVKAYFNYEKMPFSTDSVPELLFLAWFKNAPFYAISWLKAHESIPGGVVFQRHLGSIAREELSNSNLSEYVNEDVIRMYAALSILKNNRSTYGNISLNRSIMISRSIKAVAFSEAILLGSSPISQTVENTILYANKMCTVCMQAHSRLIDEINLFIHDKQICDEGVFQTLLQQMNEAFDLLSSSLREKRIKKISEDFRQIYMVAQHIEEKLLAINMYTKKTLGTQEEQVESLKAENASLIDLNGDQRKSTAYFLSLPQAIELYRKMDTKDREDTLE